MKKMNYKNVYIGGPVTNDDWRDELAEWLRAEAPDVDYFDPTLPDYISKDPSDRKWNCGIHLYHITAHGSDIQGYSLSEIIYTVAEMTESLMTRDIERPGGYITIFSLDTQDFSDKQIKYFREVGKNIISKNHGVFIENYPIRCLAELVRESAEEAERVFCEIPGIEYTLPYVNIVQLINKLPRE